MKYRKLKLTAAFLGSSFLFSAWGQTTGTLSGKINAANGQAVPSASITVTDASGQSRNVVAGADGSFTLSNLPPGTYRVEVQVPGYKRLSQQNVLVSSTNPVNLTLGVEQGNQNETVEVEGQASLVQDENAQIARSYSFRSISELPVQDRNHEQLVEQMSGVTPPLPFVLTGTGSVANTPSVLYDPQRNRTWNTNGQPAQSNNFKLDGVENLEPFRGIAVHVPTMDSIQQMNVATSNYDASEGRAAGTILQPVTRSGTNALHGSLFEYFANNWTAARNYFDPKGFPQGRFNSNEFGGSVGGALVPNKTFLFLSYEGDYLRDSTATVATVPDAAFRAGNFSELTSGTIYNPFTGSVNGTGRQAFAGNIIPASLINPASQSLLNALPQANLTGIENNYFANVPLRNDGNRADARLDHRFSDRASVFARYGLSYYNTDQESVLGAIGNGGSSRLRNHDALIDYMQGFGPTTFMDLRVSYTRYSAPIRALTGNTSAAAFGLGTGSLPSIQISGLQGIGTNPNYPQINREDTYNITNNWNARVFHQDIRFGVDIWQIRNDGLQNLLYGPQGGYQFTAGATALPGAALGRYGNFANSFAAFLLGAPTVSGVTTNTSVPSYLSRQYGGYVADRLQFLHSRLNVVLGLRYDYFGPIAPRNNTGMYSIYSPLTNTLSPLGSSTVNSQGNVQGNTLNFAPRIGLAYRFDDRTVIRAGYGWSYWNGVLQFASSSLIPATTSVENGVAGGYGVVPFGTLPQAGTSTSAATNQVYSYSPTRMRTPYVQSYNVSVQRDLTRGILAEIAYVGNTGRELPYTQNTNAALPGTGTAGLPLYYLGRTAATYLRATGSNSNYNSAQVNVTKRFSQGISFGAAYTYSKALDYGAGLTPFLNNINTRSNYGPADFDRRHLFTLTHNWRLPFGTGMKYLHRGIVGHVLGPWELDGILRYASALPFTPTASPALCACPGNTATADVVPGPTYTGISYYPGYFGYYAFPYLVPTYSFAQPANGSFGNVGRNSVRGSDFTNYDLALARSFVFVEKTRLDFRAEAYNLTNSVHFGAPIANVNSANFGQATNTYPGLGARTLQFTLRLVF